MKHPEQAIQTKIVRKLTAQGWYIIKTHGNQFQSGLPDLWACHELYGARWIEIKLPNFKGSRFTPAQRTVLPKILAKRIGIWIRTSDDDAELAKLTRKSNCAYYLRLH